jgi:flagellar biosynthesis protein FlhF
MKKFIASSLDAAKAKARRAYGDKAVIISVRSLPSGDIEVSASDRPAPAAPAQRVEPAFGGTERAILEEERRRPNAGAGLHAALEQRVAEEALTRLKGELAGRGRNAQRLDLSESDTRAMSDLFSPHGIGDELMSALVAGARQARVDSDLYRLEAAFSAAFVFAPLRLTAGKPVMLVGPTGAGKTSCAAKLAAVAMAEESAALIITADAGRAGALDQVRAYAERLGADYFGVETPHDIEQALTIARPRGAVILDTPGISPYDTGDLAALRSFQETCRAEAVLVLPASGDAAEFRDWAFAFRDFGVKRAIITKFDATKRVGAALAAAHAGAMALAQFSESAFISEGLIDANAEFLARRFIAGRPGRVG